MLGSNVEAEPTPERDANLARTGGVVIRQKHQIAGTMLFDRTPKKVEDTAIPQPTQPLCTVHRTYWKKNTCSNQCFLDGLMCSTKSLFRFVFLAPRSNRLSKGFLCCGPAIGSICVIRQPAFSNLEILPASSEEHLPEFAIFNNVIQCSFAVSAGRP